MCLCRFSLPIILCNKISSFWNDLSIFRRFFSFFFYLRFQYPVVLKKLYTALKFQNDWDAIWKKTIIIFYVFFFSGLRWFVSMALRLTRTRMSATSRLALICVPSGYSLWQVFWALSELSIIHWSSGISFCQPNSVPLCGFTNDCIITSEL